MRYILSATNRPVLKKLSSGNVLVAFDFDGTLAPIVSKPHKAAIRPGTRRLLKRLTLLYPCIVVSGRGRDDVRRKLAGLEFREVIGNHGIEPWNSSRKMARAVQAWLPILKKGLEHLHGVLLENKRFSISIHYRHARHKKNVLKTITEIARSLPGARLVGGKLVINILPEGARDKGLAVKRACQEIHCQTVIYVGDDQTDEDAFVLARRGRFLTIRVGAAKSSYAHFYIRNQLEIDRLLKVLLELRSDLENRRT